MSNLNAGNYVIINSIKANSKLVLQLITDETDDDLTAAIDNMNYLFIKQSINDGKFIKTIPGTLVTEWDSRRPIVVRLTSNAYNQLIMLINIKSETGIRVRYTRNCDDDFADLQSPIGNYKRVIDDINNLEYLAIHEDINELKELNSTKWSNLIPCDRQPNSFSNLRLITSRLLILTSAIQRWSDHSMTEINSLHKTRRFPDFDSMFKFISDECFDTSKLQANVNSLDPNDEADLQKNALLMFGTIQIRLHTQEQIYNFTSANQHSCWFTSGCPLNLIIKIKKENDNRQIGVNDLMRTILISHFESLKDFNAAHLDRLLEMNLLIPSRTTAERMRYDYFQLFERISQLSDPFNELVNYYKFNEVQNSQRFLSLFN